MELGKMGKSKLIAYIVQLQAENAKLKSQSNIADRLIDERKTYRDSLPSFCIRCGVNEVASDSRFLCRNCDSRNDGVGFVKVWQNEELEDWRNLCKLIPPLVLPENYFIKIMMPFGGIAARALIGCMDNPRRMVSVYFDPFDRLGFCGRPYWELYPSKDGDPERFYAGEEVDLVKTIVKIIESDCETMKVPENESLTEYPSEPAS